MDPISSADISSTPRESDARSFEIPEMRWMSRFISSSELALSSTVELCLEMFRVADSTPPAKSYIDGESASIRRTLRRQMYPAPFAETGQ
jgi:hypothetical protein